MNTHPATGIRHVLITGGNRGIGKAIAKQILEQGHKVCITSRSEDQGKATVTELANQTGNQDISYLQGDLSSVKHCLELSQKIKAKFPKLDVFISNAGIWMTEKKLNEDGLEVSFMVNYLAPYILCRELLPLLKENKPSRIVNVNAGLYIKGSLDVEKTPVGADFHQIKTYANSKLCGVLFTIDFARELEGSGVTLNAVHPGVINTGLGDSPKLVSKLVKFIKRFWKSPEYGAEAPVWLALSEELEGVHGNYYNEKELWDYIEMVKDPLLQQQLKEKTEAILTEKTLV